MEFETLQRNFILKDIDFGTNVSDKLKNTLNYYTKNSKYFKGIDIKKGKKCYQSS